LALVACGDVVYTPTAATVLSGGPLDGEVVVTVTSVSRAPPQLRLSFAVANEGNVPWRLAPEAQRLQLPDGRTIAAEAAPPRSVAPRQRAVVALDFPLPPHIRPSLFNLRWQIDRPGTPLIGDVRLEADTLFPTMPCGADADPYCLSGYAAP
jgi:hypothetical protein